MKTDFNRLTELNIFPTHRIFVWRKFSFAKKKDEFMTVYDALQWNYNEIMLTVSIK